MTAWSEDELRRIGEAQELEIARATTLRLAPLDPREEHQS